MPLFLASLFNCLFAKDKDYSFFKYALIILVCSGIGYLINSKILSNYFTFLSYEDIRFKTFDIDRLISLFNGLILNYGYKIGKVMSSLTITNAIAGICILLSVYAVYYPLKHKEKVSNTYYRFSLFVLFAYLVFMLLHAFTDMFYLERYYLPLIILYVPLIALLFNEAEVNVFNINKNYIYVLFVLIVFVQGVAYMYSYNNFDGNVEQREILKVLEDNDYKNGYASFKPSGKVFVLLSNEEYKSTPLKKYLNEDNVIYNSGNYIIFGYDSYEELVA